MAGELQKRVFDVALATFALVLTAPLQLAVALLVRVVLGRPVLFRQVRPGRHGTPFVLYKFRTMLGSPPSDLTSWNDVARLTGLGRALRSTSVDELPSLWNVIRGDMSLVGPRPLLTEYLPLYTPEQMRRHDVRPGLTGWAQVNGRNAADWEDRFAMDLWYVDHRSFLLDLRIIAKTMLKVLRREGISAPGSATSEPFRGNGS
jgi:lipopolysaccharide/colanic/teichoic acid biosynthesis glycosyltransferase